MGFGYGSGAYVPRSWISRILNYIIMKHLVSILFIGLIVGLSSCQSEIEQADSLRLQNKFDEAAKLYQKLSDEGNAYAMWRLSIAYSNGDGVDFDQEKALTLLKGQRIFPVGNTVC